MMQLAPQTGVMVAKPLTASESDYRHISNAMAYLDSQWRGQPGLDEIAAHVGLSAAHFQRLFVRWAGISPKDFLRAVTLKHARELLKQGSNILDTAYELGLSGPSRLHDLFVRFDAMTPGEFKMKGEGLEIYYGFHASPFGRALIMASARGLTGLGFADTREDDDKTLSDMTRRWPKARFASAPDKTRHYADLIFNPRRWGPDRPLKVLAMGSRFDVMVWETLLKIPRGHAVTYGDIAAHMGTPQAARAVGSAVGRNPASFIVPCHRVLRKSGALGGYHWGLARKRAMIGWEAAVDC